MQILGAPKLERIRGSNEIVSVRQPVVIDSVERSVLDALVGDVCDKEIPLKILMKQVNPWAIMILSKIDVKDEGCSFTIVFDRDDVDAIRKKCGELLGSCLHDLVDLFGKILYLIFTFSSKG